MCPIPRLVFLTLVLGTLALAQAACPDGRYGEQCKQKCSASCTTNKCYGKYGTCKDGCLPMHSGRFCLEAPQSCHCNMQQCDTQNDNCLDKKCEKGYFLKQCQTKLLEHINFDDSLRLDDRLTDRLSSTCVQTNGTLSFKTRNGAVYLASAIKITFRPDPDFEPGALRVYRAFTGGDTHKTEFLFDISYKTNKQVVIVGRPIASYSYLYFVNLPKFVCEVHVALGVELLSQRHLVYGIAEYHPDQIGHVPTLFPLLSDGNAQTCQAINLHIDPAYGWELIVNVNMELFPSTIYIQAQGFDECAKVGSKFYFDYIIKRTKLSSKVQISKVGTDLFEVSVDDFKKATMQPIEGPYFILGVKDTSCMKDPKIKPKICEVRLYGQLKCEKNESSFDCAECNTCKDKYCDRITGICRSGCIPGYKGLYCVVADNAKTVEADEYSYLKLDCDYSGKETGHVNSWYYGPNSTELQMESGRYFIDTNGNLHFTSVQQSDASLKDLACGVRIEEGSGAYIGYGTKHNIVVKPWPVAKAGLPVFQFSNDGVSVPLHTNATLNCFFSGFSTKSPSVPIVSWYRSSQDGVQIKTDFKKFIVDLLGRRMEILDIEEGDRDTYYCSATSGEGTSLGRRKVTFNKI